MENQAPSSSTELVPLQAPKSRSAQRWNRVFTSIAVAALAVLAWQSYDARQDVAALQQRLSENDKAVQASQLLARQRQESIDALQAKFAELEVRVFDAQGRSAALDAAYAEFSRVSDTRALDEVEQAVEIAAQQLQLGANVPAALKALQSADARLALLDQARYVPLRKLLAADIERLKALPLADVTSVALQLESMIGRVDSLPLGFERKLQVPGKQAAGASVPAGATPSSAESGIAQRLLNELWQEFSSLIRIERLDRPAPALLAPEQAAYLRENLRLRLLSARIALLQRDARLFAEDVQQARNWLQRYFDGEARVVANTLEELGLIAQARLTMNLPSLEATQLALRGLRAGKR